MPEWKQEIRRLLACLRLSPIREEAVVEELAQHLDDRYEELLIGGATEEQAFQATLAELSENHLLAQELQKVEQSVTQEPVVFGARRRNMIADLWQDTRYGMRMLLKNPGFTLIAVLTLALGIGANTAIFSLVDAFLFRLLPVKNPHQLVFICHELPNGRTVSDFPYPVFEQFRDENHSLSGLFARDDTRVSVTVDGQPELVWGDFVSGAYFDVLGVNAILGRTFTADDDRPGKEPVTVISYAYWERRFARDPTVIGKTIYLGKIPFTVIGVTSARFFGLNVAGRSAELVLPMFIQPQLALRDHNSFQIMARLKPGVSPEQARADLDGIYQHVLKQISDTRQPLQANQSVHTPKIALRPGLRGNNNEGNDLPEQLPVLFTVVGIVLLIACVNVANLLVARATGRQKEIALRLAIGASRRRLIRQLLTESVLLALLGGTLGLLFAKWGVSFLLTALSYGRDQIPFNLTLDWRILAFSGAVSLLTGIVFGLAPALTATRVELTPILKGSEGSMASRRLRGRLTKLLVVSQVALSLALLIGAGLLIRTLKQLTEVDTGFERDKVLTMWVFPALIGYDHTREMRLYAGLLERMNAIPGVQSATLSRRAISISKSGNIIGPRFFETIGVELQGRDFTAADTETSPKVAIISESLARKFFANESPLGQRLPDEFAPEFGYNVQIIGVVKDMRHRLREQEWDEAVYVPYTQVPPRALGQIKFHVRTAGNPGGIIPALRQEVQSVDRDLPLAGIETVSEELNSFLGQEGSLATLLTFFGLLALALTAIGLYGTISYTVGRRIKEIGIRMALGARRGEILWMVLRETLLLAGVGIAIGIPLALATSRLISSLLFGVQPTDLITISTAILVMLIIALFAGYIPARRATRVEPMSALRYE